MLIITLTNMSKLADMSDYKYQVMIGGGNSIRTIEEGVVIGHIREHGWETLLKKLVEERIVDNGE